MNKKQIDMIFKVLLDNDSENPFRNTLAKVNKAGRYRLRNIDDEDIEGYSFILITEYLTNVSMNYWNDMSDKEKEKDMLHYCMDGFKELSKSEGINSGVDYDRNKKTYTHLNHVNIDDLENLSDDSNEPQINQTLTKYIFNTYINERYLTPSQLRFIDTYTNNWIDEAGNIRDMKTNEILYTKQNANYHKKGIFNRLITPIENDINIDTTKDRWRLF